MHPETNTITNLTASKQKVEQLFTLDKITTEDIEHLDPPEREYLAATCTQMLNQLKGEQRDCFLNQIEHVIPASTKSDIWEYNHATINNAVSAYMSQHGTMPTKNAIANQTGLSRQTVAKHFAAHNRHPDFIATMEQFKFMAPNLLANVYKVALNGDMRAARLYLEMVGSVNKQAGTVVTGQTNYIQINNTILSQQNLNQLTPGQLNQIENIIKNTAPTKVLEMV